MNRKMKTWLLLAAGLVLAGCAIFGGVMAVFRWDFTKLSTIEYVTNEHAIHEAYRNISIKTDDADIVFVPSEQEYGSVICHEVLHAKHSATVEDDTLVIAVHDTRMWYERIGIFVGTPKITVAVPQNAVGILSIQAHTGDVEIPRELNFETMDVSVSTGTVTNEASVSEELRIKTSTGGIRIQNISAGSLELSVSTGQVRVSDVVCEGDIQLQTSTGRTTLTDVACNRVISKGTTGDLSLENVLAVESIVVERDTGDVTLDGSDAAELFIETDTGDVTGTLGSGKLFITQTSTGQIDVPEVAGNGRCEIKTSTGDIKIKVQE